MDYRFDDWTDGCLELHLPGEERSMNYFLYAVKTGIGGYLTVYWLILAHRNFHHGYWWIVCVLVSLACLYLSLDTIKRGWK